MIAARVFQAVLLWLVLAPLTGHPASLREVATVTLAAAAPLTLGFLTFIPHIGPLIGRVLQGWGAVCLWALTVALQDTTWWQAGLCTGVAWVLMQVASRLLGRPFGSAVGKLWGAITGRPAMLEARDVLAGAPFVPVESAP